VAWDKQNLYRNCGGNYEGGYSNKDCDSTAEGNSFLVIPVGGWFGDKADACRDFSCRSRQGSRDGKRTYRQDYC
jgi:hypothetical protein